MPTCVGAGGTGTNPSLAQQSVVPAVHRTPSTLLTKCLCGETNGEPEPPGSTFSPQTQPPRGCCLGLAMRKKPVLWPFFALSVGLLTGLTLSVANTWLPKYVLEHRPLVNATHENQGVETT